MKQSARYVTPSLLHCFTTSLLLLAAPASAQQWPAKPIRFIIAQAPGGQNDVQARLIGAKLAEALGQAMIYDNRPGAGGQIAFELMAQTPPDGYTIAMGSISTLAVIPMMPRKPRYDPIKDFAPVTLVTTSPYVVTVHPSIPARSIKQLVALAKARPATLPYATPGTGTGIHLTTELFLMTAGISMVHVPYKGGAPATVDLIAGHVAVMFNNSTTSVPHLPTGKLRALAVTSAKRSPILPEVPDRGRVGLPGFRIRFLAGYSDPRRNAQRHHRAAQYRGSAGAQPAGSEEFQREHRQRDRRRLAGGIRHLHTAGNGKMG